MVRKSVSILVLVCLVLSFSAMAFGNDCSIPQAAPNDSRCPEDGQCPWSGYRLEEFNVGLGNKPVCVPAGTFQPEPGETEERDFTRQESAPSTQEQRRDEPQEGISFSLSLFQSQPPSEGEKSKALLNNMMSKSQTIGPGDRGFNQLEQKFSAQKQNFDVSQRGQDFTATFSFGEKAYMRENLDTSSMSRGGLSYIGRVGRRNVFLLPRCGCCGCVVIYPCCLRGCWCRPYFVRWPFPIWRLSPRWILSLVAFGF